MTKMQEIEAMMKVLDLLIFLNAPKREKGLLRSDGTVKIPEQGFDEEGNLLPEE